MQGRANIQILNAFNIYRLNSSILGFTLSVFTATRQLALHAECLPFASSFSVQSLTTGNTQEAGKAVKLEY